MIDLSRYVFEALRKDEEFILYRGRSEDGAVQAAFASRLRKPPSHAAFARFGAPLAAKRSKQPKIKAATQAPRSRATARP